MSVLEVELPRVPEIELVALVIAPATAEFVADIEPFLVAAGEGADRPIAAVDQAVDAEALQRMVQIEIEVAG